MRAGIIPCLREGLELRCSVHQRATLRVEEFNQKALRSLQRHAGGVPHRARKQTPIQNHCPAVDVKHDYANYLGRPLSDSLLSGGIHVYRNR